MCKVIESCSTPHGNRTCELQSSSHYGSTVYSTHVYETDDYVTWREVYRSYPIGKLSREMTNYKQCCNKYLRNIKR